MTAMANNNNRNVRYVYHLPYFQRRELCRILDRMDKWEELGGIHMQFDMMTIQDLRREILRGNSPTDELLALWGHQNHTVQELFVLLSEMRHYQAMLVLKPFVNPDLHQLIYEGEELLGPLCNGIQSLGTDNKVSTEGKESAAAGEEAGVAVNGEASGLHGPSGDKNLGVGRHNLNLTESTECSHSKLTFPPEQQQPERKILNTMRLPPAQVPGSDNEAAGVPRPPAGMSPLTSEDRACRLAPDNKENNAPVYSQYRKFSNVSDVSSVTENCGSIPQIQYQELLEATQGWIKENILGKGGFGTVFKGNWKNTQVAVKRIEQRGAAPPENNQAQLEQSLRELRILNSCRHDNILPLFGFSVGGDEPCLVYQFMPNGSLEDRLLCRKKTPPLTWVQRHNIAQGTARGLQFLHNNSKPFIHGDIKSANILLDVNFIPRIGDFGLAREGPQNQYTHMKVSRVHGTRPYLPDEFLRGKQMSTKVDTYSFGIVLFELATGLRAYDDTKSYKLLKEHVENCTKEQLETLIDRKAVPENPAIFQHLVSLGLECVKKIPKQRPKMEKVLVELEAVASRHQIHDQVQYPGSLGAVSAGGQCIRTNTLTVPSHHPVISVQQQAGHNNPYFGLPPNISNFVPVATCQSRSCSPSVSPQPISAVGMPSPHALGLASHPLPVTPQYMPSPEVEVSPPSEESSCLSSDHLSSGLVKQNSDSRRSPGHDILEQELTPAAVDDPNTVEPSVQNGDADSVLLPNLSILGVSESNYSSHVGALPSASFLDVTANPKASRGESSSLSCSSAQGKSLIFDVRSVGPKEQLDSASTSSDESAHDL